MFRQTFILLLLLTPFFLKAGNGPDLDVGQAFHSSLESTHYQALLHDERPDFLRALMVAGGVEIGEVELSHADVFMEKILTQIHSQVSSGADLQVQVASISELLHREVLHKYEKIAGFHELVGNGTYNCVSATALYGLIFSALDIPFELVEQKDHVYLVVGKEDKIIVEPTSPDGEVLRPDRRMRREWLTWLKQENLVSRREIRRKGRQATFETHFFGDPQISFQQLCGIQYLNQGIIWLQEEDYPAALAAFEKAFPLYARPEVTRLRLYAAHFYAAKQVPGSVADVKAQLRLLAAVQDSTLRTQLESMAYRHFCDFLQVHNQPLHFGRLAMGMNSAGVSESFQLRIKHFYHLAAGESASDQSNFDLLWRHSEQAIALAPGDSLTQVFVVESALARLSEIADPKDVLHRLEELEDSYSFFEGAEQVRDVRAQAHLLLAATAFDQNHGSLADAHMREFEQLHPALWEGQTEKVGLAYSAAVRYHFREGNFAAARLALRKGFALVPLNRDLERTNEIFAGELDF